MPNKPGAISSVSEFGGGGRKEEGREGERVRLGGCVQNRDNTHSHTHPKAGVTVRTRQRCSGAGGHAGTPRSGPPLTTPKTRGPKHKNNAPQRCLARRVNINPAKPQTRRLVRLGRSGRVGVGKLNTDSPWGTAGAVAHANLSLSLCLSLDLSHGGGGQ